MSEITVLDQGASVKDAQALLASISDVLGLPLNQALERFPLSEDVQQDLDRYFSNREEMSLHQFMLYLQAREDEDGRVSDLLRGSKGSVNILLVLSDLYNL